MLSHSRNKKLLTFLCILGGGAVILLFPFLKSEAARIDELRAQIDNRTSEIAALEKEIQQYQTQITQTGKQITSLSGTIKTLDLTQKKLAADISVTEKKIDSTTLNIERLSIDIGDKVESIDLGHAALEDTVNILRKVDDISSIETILGAGQLSDYWKDMFVVSQFNDEIDENLASLKTQKENLEDRRDEAASEKKKLTSLRAQLADQKQIALNSQKEKQALLKDTQNKDSNYKKLLADRVARKNAFEQELRNIESQLRIEIDQSRLPEPGSRALIYPVDPPIRITQYFGNTDFAKANAQVYSGKGHNGIDLGMPTGTALKAAQFGTVIGVGDTDTTCQGASYGKWVLIRHENGLSTLYAHLSLIKAYEGQRVSAGEVIGYSGNTGYSTGPHLHFTVFATQGVSVGSLKSKVPGCGTYRLPLASLNSYLNPLSYLP